MSKARRPDLMRRAYDAPIPEDVKEMVEQVFQGLPPDHWEPHEVEALIADEVIELRRPSDYLARLAHLRVCSLCFSQVEPHLPETIRQFLRLGNG